MKKSIKITMWIILLLYTAFALWLLFVRDRGNSGMSISEHFTRYSNLLPFETIISDIKQMAMGKNVRLYIRNFFGNTMLIFPFGMFLPEDKAEVSAYAEVQVGVFSRRLSEAEMIGIFAGD